MAGTFANAAAPARGLPWLVGSSWCALVVWGWRVRDERYLNAEFGPGYALGIAGLACMSALLLYSVRKRARALSSFGPIRRWLSIHMLLGLAGPLCVLFHANFRLGSVNSSVSLACVLLVAGSGVVGRVLYPRIHDSLTGQRATLGEVGATLGKERDGLGGSLAGDGALRSALRDLERLALGQAGLAALLGRSFAVRRRGRALLRRAHSREDRRVLSRYVAAVRGVLRFRIYQRLFGLWHAFHLPLCLLLFGAAAVHVVAVHLY